MLSGLPARDRAVIVLRYYCDLSEQDTAATLGIPVGTVKSSCARALARLRVEATPGVRADEPDRIRSARGAARRRGRRPGRRPHRRRGRARRARATPHARSPRRPPRSCSSPAAGAAHRRAAWRRRTTTAGTGRAARAAGAGPPRRPRPAARPAGGRRPGSGTPGPAPHRLAAAADAGDACPAPFPRLLLPGGGGSGPVRSERDDVRQAGALDRGHADTDRASRRAAGRRPAARLPGSSATAPRCQLERRPRPRRPCAARTSCWRPEPAGVRRRWPRTASPSGPSRRR